MREVRVVELHWHTQTAVNLTRKVFESMADLKVLNRVTGNQVQTNLFPAPLVQACLQFANAYQLGQIYVKLDHDIYIELMGYTYQPGNPAGDLVSRTIWLDVTPVYQQTEKHEVVHV